MFPNSELAVEVHMESNGEDPNEWLFIVKQHLVSNRFQETGIACAVKKTVNGKKREFLLTCKDTQNQNENIFAHCACQRRWSALAKMFYKRLLHKPFDISNSREDDIFSFTPVKNCCKRGLPMVSEDKDAEKKFAAGMKVVCRSFINAGDHFRTVHWLYHKEKGEHYLQNEDFPSRHHEALGSPVLWMDDHNRSFVVGVVGYSADRNLRPKFFIDVPMAVKLCDIPSDGRSNDFTLKWLEPKNNGAIILDYMVYRRTVNESGEVSKWEFVAAVTCALTGCVVTLERGKTFDVLVTARNKCGESLKQEDNVKRVNVSEDIFANVGFGLLVLFLLGSLLAIAFWCLWASGDLPA